MDRPFVDPEARPTEAALGSVVGSAFGRFASIGKLTAAFAQEWNYSKGSGWMLKVHDGNKALLYLIPLTGAFKVSMAIREAERDALLADGSLATLHAALAAARKAPEGFAVAFEVDSGSDFVPVEAFVSKLIATRHGR